MLVEALLNILGKADIEIIVLFAQQNVYVIHSPREIIALYQSAYRQAIAFGTGHSPFAKNQHGRAMNLSKKFDRIFCEWFMVELTRIELVTSQCHCDVIPLHHSPKFCEAKFDPEEATNGSFRRT